MSQPMIYLEFERTLSKTVFGFIALMNLICAFPVHADERIESQHIPDVMTNATTRVTYLCSSPGSRRSPLRFECDERYCIPLGSRGQLTGESPVPLARLRDPSSPSSGRLQIELPPSGAVTVTRAYTCEPNASNCELNRPEGEEVPGLRSSVPRTELEQANGEFFIEGTGEWIQCRGDQCTISTHGVGGAITSSRIQPRRQTMAQLRVDERMAARHRRRPAARDCQRVGMACTLPDSVRRSSPVGGVGSAAAP